MNRKHTLTREQEVESAYIQNELGVHAKIADFASMLTKPESAMQMALANAVKQNPDTKAVRVPTVQ